MSEEDIAKQAAKDILTWRLTTTVAGATKIILDAMKKSKESENKRVLEIIANMDESDWDD